MTRTGPAAAHVTPRRRAQSRRAGRTLAADRARRRSCTCRSRTCTAPTIRFIAARDADELFDATPEPRQLVVVPGMGHAFEALAIDPVREAVAWSLALSRTAS